MLAILAGSALVPDSSSAPASGPVAAATSRAHAQADVRLAHFKHDRWTQEEGAPSDIVDMAQGKDGYLWLASKRGLFRYDGTSFEDIAAPAASTMAGASPTALLVSRKGELWVGFGRSGGVAVYRGGHLVDMGMPRPPRVVTQLVEVADGSIFATWGGISDRVWRWDGRQWMQVEARLGVPAGYISNMIATRDGSLWLSLLLPDQQSGRVGRLGRGQSRFEIFRDRFEKPRLFVDPQGNIWVSDSSVARLYRKADGTLPAQPLAYPQPDRDSFRKFAFDRWGGLWGGTLATNRLFRIPQASQAAHSAAEMLSEEQLAKGEDARSALVDSDGALWFGGSAGLQRFRFASFTVDPMIPADNHGGLKLATAKDGGVYVISRRGIYRIAPGASAILLKKHVDAFAVCAAEKDAVWFVNDAALSQLHADGSVTRVASVPTYPTTCSQDGSGRLWIRDMDNRIWWYAGGAWHQLHGMQLDGNGGTVYLVASRDGQVAMVLDDRTVGIVSGQRLMRYDLRRIGLRGIMTISPTPSGFLVSTAAGLASVGGGRMRALRPESRPWTLSLDSIVTDVHGSTWLRGADGVSRVRTADLERAFGQGQAPLARRLYDFRDGMVGGSPRVGLTGVHGVTGGDGRVWFATDEGLIGVDPARMFDSAAPPRVAVRNASTLAAHFDDPRDLDLPAGTRSIRLVYAVMGLADPDRVQVRYRLEGVDPDWVDPGSRRAISYSNLGPGTYRFQVIAESAAGLWNREGATLVFRIRPLFVESWPFRLICLVGFLVLIWLLFQLRLRIAAAQIQARLAERHDERERIARELHDTLLQSVQALILRFQLGTDRLPSDTPGRSELEGTLARAEAVLAEGRERVRDLRPIVTTDTLEPLILKAAQDRGLKPGESLYTLTSGAARPVASAAANEIVRICEEAFFNIARHARATRVDVSIEYRAQMLQLAIRDDGIGIDAAVLREGRREGHFGLTGMRERAHWLRGEMMFDTAQGGGAEIILTVPARIAYARASPWWRKLRRPWRARN